MTDEQINIAITEAIGFDTHWKVAKDYARDLNAIHEAEKSLIFSDANIFVSELAQTVGGCGDYKFPLVNATARQRAEAFLMTIGKWDGAK